MSDDAASPPVGGEIAAGVALPESGFFPGEHRFAMRVYLEDIGGGRHVYNGHFLRYVERARTDLFRLADALNGVVDRPPYQAYMVAAVEQRFLLPALQHDVLIVTTRIAHVGRSSCILDHVIRRDADDIATARVTLVYADGGRPTQQPTAWIDAFNRATAA